jgi:hypothetical protein
MKPRLRLLIVVLILAAVAWTTREVPGFGFLPLVDDDVNIAFNPNLGAISLARLHWMFTDFSYVHRYMPLGWLGFSAGYTVSGLDPVGYHVAGVILHALNALLVFGVLRLLLERFSPGAPAADREMGAGIGGLLWALHPLRVETTSWCSGLLYAQAGFFALLYARAHLGELRWLAEGRAGRSRLLFFAGFAAYAASVLTYPVVLFMPFGLAVLDVAWVRGLGERRRALLGILALRVAAMGAAAAIGLALTVYARGTVAQAWGKTPTLAEFGLLARALQAAYVGAVYLLRSVWPFDLRWMPLSLFDPGSPGALGWASAGVLAVVTAAVWRLRRRAPYLAPCWAAYLVLIIPNLGLTEHPHTIADRYLYVTGIAFVAALVFAVVGIRRAKVRLAAFAACAVLAGAWALVSLREARDWRSTGAFQAHILGNPDPDLRHITLARMGKLRFLEGDVRGGREAVRAELREAPAVGGVVLTWGQVAPSVYLSPSVAEARLQEWPAAPFSVADATIARQEVQEGRVEDALLHLDSALSRSPLYMEARFRRGLLLAALGRAPDALHDWIYIERLGTDGGAGSRGRAAFMGDYLEKQFSEQGNTVALRAVRLERARR